MYHSFLIHSSADGHLGCFHVLAIINSAVMNTGVQVSISDLVFLVCRLSLLSKVSPGGSDDKSSTCNAGDGGLIPGLGKSPGEGNGNPLQDSCLEKYHGQRNLVGLCS